MVTTWLAVEPVIGFGVRLPTTGGAGGAVTFRLAALDAGPVGLATVMLQVRAVVPVAIIATIWVALRLVTARLVLRNCGAGRVRHQECPRPGRRFQRVA